MICHQGLLFKLKKNRISGKLLIFFESHLHNRKQRVALNGFFSEFAHIESGVPQGSVIGPLLFLIYNIFFADDTMLFSVIKDPQLSASDLYHDLEVINQWAYQWKMAFNPDPIKQATEILFSYKKKERNPPELTFNGAPVARMKQHKHLGLIPEPNLSFVKHLYKKMVKAKKNIGIIKHLNRFLLFKTLNQIYKALVCSHLDYYDIIYHIPPIVHHPPLGTSLNNLM